MVDEEDSNLAIFLNQKQPPAPVEKPKKMIGGYDDSLFNIIDEIECEQESLSQS